MQYMPYMSHGTDVVEGRSADVTHLAIHGKVTVKSNSNNFDLILECSTDVGDFDCCDVRVTISSLPGTKKNGGVCFIRVESQTVLQ